MATHINDLISSTLLDAILAPLVIDDASPVGEAVDLGAGDGLCYGVQLLGEISEGASLTGRMEESHDGTTWAAVAGATFAEATAPGSQVIRFHRSRRYVRWAGTFTAGEGGTAICAACVVQSRKTF